MLQNAEAMGSTVDLSVATAPEDSSQSSYEHRLPTESYPK
jgi:hypothetical protein